jgi:hypothetical protein
MVNEAQKLVDGFLFSTSKEFNQGKSEFETITYLKEKSDLSNPRIVLKLYNKLIESDTFHTMVGYVFLKELQDIIVKANIIKEEELTKIYIPTNLSYDEETTSKPANQYKITIKNLQTTLRNTRIINVFLVTTVIIMFVLALFADKSAFSNFETEIINQYSTWQEDLKSKEEELKLFEENLNEREKNIVGIENGNR